MSADRLREAAGKVRATVDRLTSDRTRWDEAFPVVNVYPDLSTYERLIVHPGVGLALADWLEGAAKWLLPCEQPCWERGIEGCPDCEVYQPAVSLADLILGGTP